MKDVNEDLENEDSDVRSKYENFVIAEPDEREDSDRDESTLVSVSHEMTDVSHISIVTSHIHEGLVQPISNPLSLKFVDLDDSSDEIKEEEEAHEYEDTDTRGVDDDELLLTDSEEPLNNQKLKINKLVDVCLHDIWFPSRIFSQPTDDTCIVTISNSVVARHFEIVGVTVRVPQSRIKPLRNDRSTEKTIPLSNLAESEVELKLKMLASLEFNLKEGHLTIGLNCRACWQAWDLIWQRLATCKGFALHEFLESEGRLRMKVLDDSS